MADRERTVISVQASPRDTHHVPTSAERALGGEGADGYYLDSGRLPTATASDTPYLSSSEFSTTPTHRGADGVVPPGALPVTAGDVVMKPRAFFAGKNQIPLPPPDKTPVAGLQVATSPSTTIDIARIGFHPLGLVFCAVCFTVAIAFVVLPVAHVFLHDVHKAFPFAIAGGFFGTALIASAFVTSSSAHFDRRHRVVVLLEKRLFLGACCRNRREVPFRVLETARFSSKLGQTVTLQLVVNTAELTRLVADGEVNADDAMVDERVVDVARVENAPDVLRSWQAYVEWLRDDAFVIP